MAKIYALFSARDGRVRYVGETLGARQDRFKKHHRGQVGRRIMPVEEWIRAEWREGFPVRCALLEWCKDDQRHDLETEWIAKFPNLLNERKRPFYSPRCRPPIVPEIRDYMRRWKFNSGGYRGVHWCRENDRYAVFSYVVSEPRWLLGDEDPIKGQAIWFTDRYKAVEARDWHRNWYKEHGGMRWLPDLNQDDWDSDFSLVAELDGYSVYPHDLQEQF